jgi:hypothetical protein
MRRWSDWLPRVGFLMRKHYHIVWKDHETGEKCVDLVPWDTLEVGRNVAKRFRNIEAKETWVVRKCRLKCEAVNPQ